MKSIMPIKTAYVIVRTVNNFFYGDICQNVSEGSEIIKRYRIDNVDFVTRGDLNKTELLGVTVEAVGFCIQGNDL